MALAPTSDDADGVNIQTTHPHVRYRPIDQHDCGPHRSTILHAADANWNTARTGAIDFPFWYHNFHGSVYDFVIRRSMPTPGRIIAPASRGMCVEQTGARVDGPLGKNKTFSRVFEASINRTKSSVTNTVLTDMARQGIFDSFLSQNGNASVIQPWIGGQPVTPRGARDFGNVSLFGRDQTAHSRCGRCSVSRATPSPNNFLTAMGATQRVIWRRGASILYSISASTTTSTVSSDDFQLQPGL